MFEIKLSDQVWNSCKNGNQLKAYYCQIILITGTSCEDVFVYSKFKTCVLMSNHILWLKGLTVAENTLKE